MKKSLIAVAVTGLLGLAASAQAATESFTVTQPLGLTDFSSILSVNKFDTRLGTLSSISFTLNGTVSGVASAENLDDASSSIVLSLASNIALLRPDHSTLVSVNPGVSHNLALGGFDGDIDFAGASGGSTGTVSNSATHSFSSSSANDFALFSAQGGGLINLGVTALGTSDATGSGNLVTDFETRAGASVTVTYNYAPVPEPETYALMLAGLGMLGFARRRRSAKLG